MACFLIIQSEQDHLGSRFRVTWRGSEIHEGDVFEAYEAGHWWTIPVTKLVASSDGADIWSTFPLGFDGQFEGAVVDTESPRYDGRFRYERTVSD